MQYMNGFELCEKIFATDINVRACFMSSGEVNREATKQLVQQLYKVIGTRRSILDYLVQELKALQPAFFLVVVSP
jgi:hypothetical protein